ncbi:hypothetical protein AAC387_Pa06g1101 [Persea americana]
MNNQIEPTENQTNNSHTTCNTFLRNPQSRNRYQSVDSTRLGSNGRAGAEGAVVKEFRSVLHRVHQAAERSGRPYESVMVVAVS